MQIPLAGSSIIDRFDCDATRRKDDGGIGAVVDDSVVGGFPS